MHKNYTHDTASKIIIERLLAWDYTSDDKPSPDGIVMTAGRKFREDLASAFHWPATPQGVNHWTEVSDINPKNEVLDSEDKEYLEWLAEEIGKPVSEDGEFIQDSETIA